MVMGCGGAMHISEEAWSTKRVLCDGEGASVALGRERKGRGRQTLSVEVNIRLASPLGFIYPRSHAPRNARPMCINCRRTTQPLTGGTHHDRGNRAHARALSLRRGNRKAAAGCHVRLPTSSTTRAVAAFGKARPRCRIVAATLGIKWSGPLPSKDDPRAARAPGSKNLTHEGCDLASKPVKCERAPQVPSIYKTTDQQFEGRPGRKPSKPADAKRRGHPAVLTVNSCIKVCL
jgi:hypothetical protein